ncbi:hypothetical protein, partial [Streptomyces sp. NPDC001985]|uniref:hypothetical protein n=1 Tax=Streptomyces sp. NPDC001985 TaxID=3154406 RepID=UPI003318D1E8
ARLTCTVWSVLPTALARLISRISPNLLPGHPDGPYLIRCHLERHRVGPHWAMVWPVAGQGEGMLWAHWSTGGLPARVLTRPVCPETDGPHKECALYQGHPDGHSYELTTVEPDELPGPIAVNRLRACLQAVNEHTGRNN